MLHFDVVIIGSGIAGMTSAIYLRRANLKTLIIESDTPGGQLNRSSIIENYPGFINVDGPTLASAIYNQVLNLEADFLYSKASEVDFENKIITADDKKITYEYLIIATGRSPRKLNLENEENLIGKGISYCALCDGGLYKNKNVIVLGGGSSALEEALYLSGIAKRVTLIHRRNSFTAEQEEIDRVIAKNNIKIIYNANIIKYNLKDNKLTSVTLDNKKKITTDGLFISIGYVPNSQLFSLEKDNDYLIVNENNKTNIDNVYAVGDIIKKTTYQLVTATGEAAIASNDIINKISKKA